MAIPTLPPPSAKAVEVGERVKAFLEEHIIPAEHTYHQQLDEGESRWHTPPIMNELKAKAKKAAETDPEVRSLGWRSLRRLLIISSGSEASVPVYIHQSRGGGE